LAAQYHQLLIPWFFSFTFYVIESEAKQSVSLFIPSISVPGALTDINVSVILLINNGW